MDKLRERQQRAMPGAMRGVMLGAMSRGPLAITLPSPPMIAMLGKSSKALVLQRWGDGSTSQV